MRKNRKRSNKLSVIALNTMRFGAVIVITAVMSIVRMLADSSCDQLMKTIGEKERLLNQYEEARQRESAQWEEMKTPDKLDRVLMQRGMAMRYPKADQVVRMKSNGRPYPGQISVARARQRNGLNAAQYRSSDDDTLPRSASGKYRTNRKFR